MPTYTCYSGARVIDAEQRQRIAAGITAIHSEETGAPVAFTQCIFREIDSAAHFIGGAPAPHDGIWIYGHIRDGRTPVVKTLVLQRIRDLMIDVVGLEPDVIWVYLNELRHTDMIEFGHVLPEQGQESEWVAKLPAELRELFVALGGAR